MVGPEPRLVSPLNMKAKTNEKKSSNNNDDDEHKDNEQKDEDSSEKEGPAVAYYNLSIT